MQLVDEQDDVALRVLHFLQHGLQPVFELATVLGPGDEGAEVEGYHFLVLERLGHVAAHHALGEALHDRGLAHAGLADEHGIVLGAAREHLYDAAHLVVAADDGVELALACQRGEVAAIALEGLVAVLGVGVVHPLVASDLAQDREHALAADAVALQRVRGRGLPFEQGEEQMLGGDVLVLEGFGFAQARLERRVELGRDMGGRPLGAGKRGESAVDIGTEGRGRDADLAKRRRNHPAFLVEQGPQEMLGHHLGAVVLFGEGLRGAEGLLGFDRELIESHGNLSFLVLSSSVLKIGYACHYVKLFEFLCCLTVC